MRFLLLFFVSLLHFSAYANNARKVSYSLKNQSLTAKQIDVITSQVMAKFHIPGVAIGIIHQGKVVFEKGYGVKRIGSSQPFAANKIDNHTIFKIASNTKAFTSAALAILVDEGKLNWHDKVIDYLPNFKLSDDWITKNFTIIDLLTHRSGLGLGAGDLMLWPEPSSFTRDDVIKNLRYLPIKGEFRTSYAYDNLLYIVAGQLIPAITGMSWQKFVQLKIMKKLGMKHCFAGKIPANQLKYLAKPYVLVKGKLTEVKRKIDENKESVSAAAGGIQCSLHDMLTWLQVFLHQGEYGQKSILFSPQQLRQLWQGETIMPVSKRSYRWDHTHFSQYALGWRKADVNGILRIYHTGSLSGMYSYVSLFPELNLGIVVLTNQQSSNARNALMYSIMKPYLPLTQSERNIDWVAEMLKYEKSPKQQNVNKSDKIQKTIITLTDRQLHEYVGVYQDKWLGDFTVKFTRDRHQLFLRSKRVIKFIGKMVAIDKDKFVVRWQDRTLEADVYVQFKRNNKHKVIAMKLIPVSKNIDFSYDFQDLNLLKK